MKVKEAIELMRSIVSAYDRFEAKRLKIKNKTKKLLKGGKKMKFGTIIGIVVAVLALIAAGAAAAYFLIKKNNCCDDCCCDCCDCDDELFDEFPAEECCCECEAPAEEAPAEEVAAE